MAPTAPPDTVSGATAAEVGSTDWTTLRDFYESRDYPYWLTPKQRTIAESILDRVRRADSDSDAAEPMVLRGAAGTGKSRVITTIVQQASIEGYLVAVAAFTHKACSVIRANLEESINDGFPVELPIPVTLHRLLKLKPARNLRPDQPEAFEKTGNAKLSHLSLVIVDECSMVGTAMYDEIVSALTGLGIPVLFAGDHHQLPPVKESDMSKAFSAPKQYSLTRVLRHDGAILNYATKLRKSKYPPNPKSDKSETSVLSVIPNRGFFNQTWLLAVRKAHSEHWTSNRLIMLCYTNTSRRKYNASAREALYGKNHPRFVPGDVVTTLAPILRRVGNEDQVIYDNNQDIRIDATAVHKSLQPIPELNESFHCWELTTEDGEVITALYNAAEEDRLKSLLARMSRELVARGKRAKALGDHREAQAVKIAWAAEFFPLRGFFANIDFRYALTIHKAQGSTFENVFLDGDYRSARTDMKKLLYVAVTRASRSLTVGPM
jgi:exodeoxyribonuclease-5